MTFEIRENSTVSLLFCVESVSLMLLRTSPSRVAEVSNSLRHKPILFCSSWINQHDCSLWISNSRQNSILFVSTWIKQPNEACRWKYFQASMSLRLVPPLMVFILDNIIWFVSQAVQYLSCRKSWLNGLSQWRKGFNEYGVPVYFVLVHYLGLLNIILIGHLTSPTQCWR